MRRWLAERRELPMRAEDEAVVIQASGVSKKFCKNLRRGLWYGVKDVASELAV